MKRTNPENEKLVSRESLERLRKVFIDDPGFDFAAEDTRLDRETYPMFLNWLVNEGPGICTESKYALSDVLRIYDRCGLRLNKSKLRQWLNRDQITPISTTKQGKGKHHKFSIIDLLIIYLALRLTDIRAPISLTEQLKNPVLHRLKTVVERTQQPGICRITLNFLPGFEQWDASCFISEELPNRNANQPVFIVINVDQIIYECLSDLGHFMYANELKKSPTLQAYLKDRDDPTIDHSVLKQEIASNPYLNSTITMD